MTNGKGSCTITPPEYGIDDFAATFARNAADKASSYAGPYALAVMNTTTTTVVVTLGHHGRHLSDRGRGRHGREH